MERHEEVLRYLNFHGGKGKQKHHMKADMHIPQNDRYLDAVMTKLKKQGLVKCSTYMGWWSITEQGRAYLKRIDPNLPISVLEEYIEIDTPFFSEEEVNQSVILRAFSTRKERNKPSADSIPDHILEFFIGIYLIKHDLPFPVGHDLNEYEDSFFNRYAETINDLIKAWSRRQNNLEENNGHLSNS